MNKRKSLLFFLVIVFLLPYSASLASNLDTDTNNDLYISQEALNDNYKKQFDINSNRIHDHFESLIMREPSDYHTAIVMFDNPITDKILLNIESLSGEILSKWTVINGAAVNIKGSYINSLANLPGVNFIHENYKSKALLSTSVRQINVRPYVWNTLGFEGSSSHAIAIMDTGIDDTHSDLSGRVTGWIDYAGVNMSIPADEYVLATDMNGHGTHVASIAAGSGAASDNNATLVRSGTIGLPPMANMTFYYSDQIEIETVGDIKIEVQWDDKTGNSPTDTLFVIFDSNHDLVLDGSDDIQYGDYGPLLTYIKTGLSAGKYVFGIGTQTAGELGSTTVQYRITRPAYPTSDGNNKYRGVAPNCDIVGVKVLDDSGVGDSVQFINGLDWVLANAATYGIVVASMSLGFPFIVPSVDSAVNSLVEAGIVCVAAAGNGFQYDETIFSPGTALKAITVGAIDDVDKVAIYSSNGDGSHDKPDILAPGGAYASPLGATEITNPIIAADTNDADLVSRADDPSIEYFEPEMTDNDYASYQGTSMATPHISGLVALMIQAMGSDWTGVEADVLRIKNYICGTATEVRLGESYGGYHNLPSLDRGYRDKIEGFGKVHGDAAIEAFLSTYTAGTNVTESLSSLPYGMQCWARKVELVELIEFTAGIEMDGSADFDLYLYNPSVDMTSNNAILDSSTTATQGVPENILYTPANNMTAYIVVKRVGGSGSFTLQAEATKTGTPTNSFTFPFGLSVIVWLVLGIAGISSIILTRMKKK